MVLLAFDAHRGLCNVAQRKHHAANFPPTFACIISAVYSPIFDTGT